VRPKRRKEVKKKKNTSAPPSPFEPTKRGGGKKKRKAYYSGYDAMECSRRAQKSERRGRGKKGQIVDLDVCVFIGK